MKPAGSLEHSQVTATYPHTQLDQSSPWLQPTSLRSILISSSHLRLGLPSGLFHSGSPTKIVYALPISTEIYHIPTPTFEYTWLKQGTEVGPKTRFYKILTGVIFE